jgi:protein-L-isoaspartate O-methyltransferase
MQTTDTSAEQNAMVDHQIEARGVRDRLVLSAMRKVPREEFVPENLREFAFDETSAVSPFSTSEIKGMPDTYPFRL